MKILHIIPNLAGGGAERFVVDLVNEMSTKHEVYLCTLYELISGVNDFFLFDLTPNVKLIQLKKKLGLDLVIFKRVTQVISSLKPDIVNTHLASVNYVLPSIVGRMAFRHRIHFFHTIHSDAKIEIKHHLEFLSRKYLYKARALFPITISEESQDSFHTLYKLYNDHLIYNGRKFEAKTSSFELVEKEFELFRTTKDTKVLINIGRFVALKNQVFLAKIVDHINRKGHDISLIIIGDFSNEEGIRIKEQIENLNNKNIHLLGLKRNVIDYLSLSDAFCLSSTYEGMPISLLEAMSVGCIPICTPVGGLKNIISSEKYGYVSNDLTEKSFSDTIHSFLESNDNDKIRKEVISKYHAVFNIKSTASAYLDLYEGKAALIPQSTNI